MATQPELMAELQRRIGVVPAANLFTWGTIQRAYFKGGLDIDAAPEIVVAAIEDVDGAAWLSEMLAASSDDELRTAADNARDTLVALMRAGKLAES